MKKWYLLAVILGSFLSATAQQTSDELIADVIALTPRSLVKYETKPRTNVFLLRTGFNDAIYQDKASAGGSERKSYHESRIDFIPLTANLKPSTSTD